MTGALKELASIRNVPTRIRRLISYASDHQRGNSEDAHRAAREALRLSQQLKNKELIATSLRTLGLGLYFARQYKDALVELEAALQIYEKRRETNTIARTLQNIGLCHVRLGQHEPALHAYTRSQELFRKSGDDANRSLVLINLGVVYTTINNQLKAFETYSEALELLEKLADEHGIAVVSGNVGQLFIGMGDNDKGLQWMERCLETHRKIDNPRGIGFALREIGSLNQNIGRINVASQHFNTALRIYEETQDPAGQAEVRCQLAELALVEDRFVSAMDHCHNARRLFVETQDSINTARTYNIEGRIYSSQKKYDDAITSYREAVTAIQRSDNYAMQAEYIYNLAQLLVQRKRGAESLRLLQRALKLAEAHDLHQVQASVHDLLSQHFEKSSQLTQSLRHVRKAQDALRIHEQQLTSRKVQDLKYRVDIAKVERDRELMRQQSEQYRTQLETKSKELNASALSLAQKNEVISSLKQRILSLSRHGADNLNDGLRELLKLIDEHLRGDKQMEGVTKQLSDFHQDFITKLSSEFRSLTPTEIKICSLLKLNLNTKEIADFLCVSFKSVEVYRARIRKKLGLAEGENLSAFIMSYERSAA